MGTAKIIQLYPRSGLARLPQGVRRPLPARVPRDVAAQAQDFLRWREQQYLATLVEAPARNIAGRSPFDFAIGDPLFSVVCALLLIATAVVAYADSAPIETLSAPEVMRVADRVAEIMNLPPLTIVPPAVMMERCNGHAGETDGKVIRVCSREPEACRVRIIGHEIAHLLILKHRGAVADAEGLALAVEDAIDGGFKPNCEGRR